jgi:hypothetical protein
MLVASGPNLPLPTYYVGFYLFSSLNLVTSISAASNFTFDADGHLFQSPSGYTFVRYNFDGFTDIESAEPPHIPQGYSQIVCNVVDGSFTCLAEAYNMFGLDSSSLITLETTPANPITLQAVAQC